jgi:exopolyphosphatase / guanosine-5'-triphosphate,3'-diphosphate pyrophosphatase
VTRLATIDLGSNTVRLLVAEADGPRSWRVAHREQLVTRLGEGLATAGVLGDGPMARTAETVAGYVERARALGAGVIRIVATSAVREAANGAAFAGTLERLTRAPVVVVTGQDEARLTVRGVLDGLGGPAGSLLIVDIGGGSTEYTLVHDGVVRSSASLRLGVVPLAERFPFPGRVERGRFGDLEGEIRAELRRGLPPEIADARGAHLVGTAGTVTTLAALDLGLQSYDAARVHGHRLDRLAIARQFERLAGLTVQERGALPALEPGRADLIVPGLAIVTVTMTEVEADGLVVSDAGLREGMMAEAVERVWSI